MMRLQSIMNTIRFKRLRLTEPLFHYSPPPHSSMLKCYPEVWIQISGFRVLDSGPWTVGLGQVHTPYTWSMPTT